MVAVRSIARRLDAKLALSRLETLTDAMRLQLLLPRVAAGLFGGLAVTGLLLVGVGVAGVSAHAAGSRTREMGIRMAQGARGRDVLALLMRESLAIVAFGSFAGLGLTLAVTPGLSTLLHGIRPSDPATYLVASGFLAGVAATAGYVPARRASRMNPQQALRCE
jgi:ABC-type antimicrobial peptide transport system permease subunit